MDENLERHSFVRVLIGQRAAPVGHHKRLPWLTIVRSSISGRSAGFTKSVRHIHVALRNRRPLSVQQFGCCGVVTHHCLQSKGACLFIKFLTRLLWLIIAALIRTVRPRGPNCSLLYGLFADCTSWATNCCGVTPAFALNCKIWRT